MDIKIESLIPFEVIKVDVDHVLSTVDRNGKVVLIKDNKPAYIILKYDEDILYNARELKKEISNFKLHEAMKIVLSGAYNKTMHAAELADEIYRRRLYLKKNGEKAEYTQIRARCGKYPELFEALPGNYIRLRE